MAIDFPNSPALNQTYTSGGQTWYWDGVAWTLSTTTISGLVNGAAGQIPYQSGVSTTAFVPTGPTGSALTANGVNAPTWTAQSSLAVGSATNLASGLAGQMPYQSGAGATAFVPTGPTGNVLIANGSAAPTWSATPLPVYTYATRPTSGTSGQMIYLSDTDEYEKWATDADGTTRWMQGVLKPNRNLLVNGSLAVWQRNTTFNPTSATIATTATAGTGTTATLTVASHTFQVGQWVTVAGVTPTGYNGTYQLTAVTATTLSYANATTGAQTVAGTVASAGGVSTTGANYGADRWQMLQATTNTSNAFVRTATTSADPVGYNYYCRVQRTNGLNFTTPFTLQTSLESANIQSVRGKYVTLSFWARAGANYSAASSYLVSSIVTGTGTDNTVGNFTTNTVNTTINNVLTTSWKRFVITTSAALATTITQLGVSFVFTPTGTASTVNDYYDITGVQLEVGTAPSDFEFRELGDELRRCQRYFERYAAADGTTYPPQNPCNVDVPNRPEVILQYQRKRTTPTIAVSSSTGFTFESLTQSTTAASVSFSGTLVGTGVQSANLFFGVTAWTQYLPCILLINASQYIDINAEL
jgi:hypothetical protein